MTDPNPFIVGRQAEVEHFAALMDGRADHWILNIFGPGGIGKTAVCTRLSTYARAAGLLFARVDGDDSDLTPIRMLDAVRAGLAADVQVADAFALFEQQFNDYLVTQDVLQRSGGIQLLFDTVGNLREPAAFEQIVSSVGRPVSAQMHSTVSNRFALERYVRSAEKTLTKTFSDGLGAALDRCQQPIAVLIDTYEQMEALDDWICRSFVPALPARVKVVLFGRNALPRINFDWAEFGNDLQAMELPELSELDAKRYLQHHGLNDAVALDQIYRFTGGYPLLLVLVRHLVREAGSWNAIGGLESETDRDQIASQLLDRILSKGRTYEVKAFLEKGVVAQWFNAEIVSVLLEVSPHEGRDIYEKLRRHSFVERHRYGLKFHDKIRELLLARLKFTSQAEYERLTQRLMAYFAEQAGRANAATATRPLAVQSPPDVPQLHHVLNERLNLEEVRTLCFDLSVDFDNLGGETKEGKVRELLLLLQRRSEVPRLLTWVKQRRPDISLPEPPV